MQANWSLVLNVVLLIGVVIAIGCLMKVRRQNFAPQARVAGTPRLDTAFDEILSVRRISGDEEEADALPVLSTREASRIVVEATPPSRAPASEPRDAAPSGGTIMLFLRARENRQFAGYELLQTILAAGLRFGEGQIFHRYQNPNGTGAVLCSLAAATASGVFDLQNIGAFGVRGLCLFMEQSGNSGIDEERLNVMLDTARHLADGLDADLLDASRRTLTDEAIHRLHRQIGSVETDSRVA